MRLALRLAGVAIAFLALIDPSTTRERLRGQTITIVTDDSNGLAHAERLRKLLADEYEVKLGSVDPASRASACPATGGCVLVQGAAFSARLSAGATVIGALQVPPDETRIIRDLDAPRRVHLEATAVMHVTLDRGVDRVDVFDGNVLVGSSDARGQRDLDVTWVPLAAGARALRVVAGDDVVVTGVIVDDTPVRVLVYETEPTWLGTFVRRALQDDPRFTVGARTRVAPPISVASGEAPPLGEGVLDEARVVVVAAPERLQAADVDLLDRFVTRRGGSVVLLAHARPSGPVLTLMPRVAREARHAETQPAGLLRVREWLAFERAPGAAALASVGSEPIVVSQPLGRGRVITSGALDAWRFRSGSPGFASFWTSLLWHASTAAGGALQVATDRVAVRPGEPLRVTAELQAMDPPPETLAISGVFRCNSTRTIMRFWPSGRPGAFEAVVHADKEGWCDILVQSEAESHDRTATAEIVVDGSAKPRESSLSRLEAAVRAYGGVVVAAGDEHQLLERARAALPRQREVQRIWPMRSPWWLIGFAACLAGEWWLRRRSGLS